MMSFVDDLQMRLISRKSPSITSNLIFLDFLSSQLSDLTFLFNVFPIFSILDILITNIHVSLVSYLHLMWMFSEQVQKKNMTEIL